MAYRIVSIENPAEVHVRDEQLVVIQDKGTVTIPIRDILVLVVCGPNIRMSTMAQTMLASSKVVMLFLGRNHHPVAMTLPVVGYSRQARVMQAQAAMSPNLRSELWRRIIVRKIENQARALAILGLEGAEELWSCSQDVLSADADNREGFAAKRYFQYLQPGLSRREEDPLNSALNHGYAIVRALVALRPATMPACTTSLLRRVPQTRLSGRVFPVDVFKYSSSRYPPKYRRISLLSTTRFCPSWLFEMQKRDRTGNPLTSSPNKRHPPAASIMNPPP